MRSARPAAEIEPVRAISSSNATLPGPIWAPGPRSSRMNRRAMPWSMARGWRRDKPIGRRSPPPRRLLDRELGTPHAAGAGNDVRVAGDRDGGWNGGSPARPTYTRGDIRGGRRRPGLAAVWPADLVRDDHARRAGQTRGV